MADSLTVQHCGDCNRDYVLCANCTGTWRTNVTSGPPVQGHQCSPSAEEPTGTKTATAAAAGAAGGAATGAAGGAAVTAGAPAVLSAAGFTSSGVAGGSLAAAAQSALYAGATPAGGWFATCTSAAMGGAMGAAAVAAVAATTGVAVAAGAGYGIYRLVKNKTKDRAKCPWCGKGPRKDSEDSEKGRPVQASPAKPVEKKEGWKRSSSSGVAVGDFFLRTEEEMVEFALKRSLEEQLCSRPAGSPSDGAEQNNPQAGNRDTLQFDEFDCPICAEVMRSPHEIWQCGEGHILCGRCRHNPSLPECPVCRGHWSQGSRNRAMEALAVKLAI